MYAPRSTTIPALRTMVFCVAAPGFVWAPMSADALPMKTKAGNPVENLVYRPAGVPAAGLGPGYVKETGDGPPPRITHYAMVSEFTAMQKTNIKNADKANHPSITFSADPTVVYDCHGLTFKSGTVWINNDQVDKVLTDQGWTVRAAGAQQVGDIVVYRKGGKITHTGIVTAVAGGNATRVKSKWGNHGEYIHDIGDVPRGAAADGGVDYGTAQVYGGGAVLADPPISDEDINVFQGKVPPPLKDSLRDTNFNDFPIPELQATLTGPFDWQYGLDLPELGLTVSPGDTLELFGMDLVSASVTGLAASSSFGAWQLQSLTSESALFVATTSAFVPFDSVSLIDGFQISSAFGGAGDMVYIESVAGSVGLAAGPIPEPASLLLMILGSLTLCFRRRAF